MGVFDGQTGQDNGQTLTGRLVDNYGLGPKSGFGGYEPAGLGESVSEYMQ